MQNLVSGSFLLSLCWRELACLGVLVCLAMVVTAGIALRNTATKCATNCPIDLTERHSPKALKDEAQYVLPFLNESVDGEKVNCHVRRKDNQYVQVNLRIRLAG
jgi:hypothetical protein